MLLQGEARPCVNKKYLQVQPFTHNAKDLHYVAVLRAQGAIQPPIEAGCSP
jgi:hypothetical protein